MITLKENNTNITESMKVNSIKDIKLRGFTLSDNMYSRLIDLFNECEFTIPSLYIANGNKLYLEKALVEDELIGQLA